MAISVRTQQFYGVSGQNPAAQSITTQAGDKAVILIESNWDGGVFSSTSLDGDTTPDGNASQDDAGTSETCHIVVWLDPPIGTLSIDWAYGGTPADGPAVWAIIVACDGTISLVDIDVDAGDGTSVTSTCAVGDLAVAAGFQFDAAASVGGDYDSGDALAADQVFNGQHGRPYAQIIASGTTINATSDFGVAQVVLRETASGPTLVSTTPTDNSVHVATSQVLSFTISEDVQVVSGNVTIKRTSDDSTFATLDVTNGSQVSISGAVVTLTHSALELNTEYYVLVDAGAFEATVGGADWPGISSTTAWSFRTTYGPGTISRVGSLSTGTGAAASTVAVTGIPFTPRFVLFWWSGRTNTTDSTGSATHRRGFGYAISSSSRGAITSQSEDNSTVGDCDSGHRTDACIATLSIAGAIDGLMDFVGFTSDGFTLVVDDVMPNDLRVHYCAWGGDDFTVITAGVLTEPGATGNQDVTVTGFTATDGARQAVLFLSAMIGADPPGTAVDSNSMFGFAAGATPASYVWAGAANNGADPMVAGSYNRGGECIAMINAGVTATDGHASVSAWLTDGFRLDWTERAASRRVLWVAMKGPSFFAGDLLTQTDTTTDIVESGFGFAPRGAFFLSDCKAQSASDTFNTTDDEWSFGACSDASTERAMASMDDAGVGTSETSTAVEHDAVYVNISTADANEGAMQCIAFGSDGFTCEMTDADPSQAFVSFLSWGDAPSAVTLASLSPDEEAPHTLRARRLERPLAAREHAFTNAPEVDRPLVVRTGTPYPDLAGVSRAAAPHRAQAFDVVPAAPTAAPRALPELERDLRIEARKTLGRTAETALPARAVIDLPPLDDEYAPAHLRPRRIEAPPDPPPRAAIDFSPLEPEPEPRGPRPHVRPVPPEDPPRAVIDLPPIDEEGPSWHGKPARRVADAPDGLPGVRVELAALGEPEGPRRPPLHVRPGQDDQVPRPLVVRAGGALGDQDVRHPGAARAPRLQDEPTAKAVAQVTYGTLGDQDAHRGPLGRRPEAEVIPSPRALVQAAYAVLGDLLGARGPARAPSPAALDPAPRAVIDLPPTAEDSPGERGRHPDRRRAFEDEPPRAGIDLPAVNADELGRPNLVRPRVALQEPTPNSTISLPWIAGDDLHGRRPSFVLRISREAEAAPPALVRLALGDDLARRSRPWRVRAAPHPEPPSAFQAPPPTPFTFLDEVPRQAQRYPRGWRYLVLDSVPIAPFVAPVEVIIRSCRVKLAGVGGVDVEFELVGDVEVSDAGIGGISVSIQRRPT